MPGASHAIGLPLGQEGEALRLRLLPEACLHRVEIRDVATDKPILGLRHLGSGARPREACGDQAAEGV